MSTGGSGSNGVIQTDLTGGASDDTFVNKNWTNTQSTGGGALGNNNSLANTTKTATKTHNGVTWTYSNPKGAAAAGAKADEAQSNAITITGKVNIYKAMNGNKGYQTYIKNATGARAEEGITVTITLMPNTLPAQPQNVKK